MLNLNILLSDIARLPRHVVSRIISTLRRIKRIFIRPFFTFQELGRDYVFVHLLVAYFSGLFCGYELL